MGQALVAGVVAGGIYGLIAVGIVLVYKGSRVLNFAQGEIGTFALFVAWWFIDRRGMSWPVGAALGLGAGVVLALAFERLVVRRMTDASRLSIAVATVGFFLFLIALESFVFSEALLVLPAPVRGLGPKVFGFYVGPMSIISLVAVAVIALGLAAFLRRTDFGLGVLAASQDPTMVRLVGVRLSRVSAFTWGVAGGVGALAALLIEPTIGAFAPGFMTQFFIRGLAAALLGGLASLPGAFVGGIAVGLVEATMGQLFVQSSVPGIRTMTVITLIVLVLLVRPAGLLGKTAR